MAMNCTLTTVVEDVVAVAVAEADTAGAGEAEAGVEEEEEEEVVVAGTGTEDSSLMEVTFQISEFHWHNGNSKEFLYVKN